MRFTAITLLALGASTSAYVVPDTKQIQDKAVEARMPGNGHVQAINLVAALAGRDIEAREPHHKGKGKKNNRREAEVDIEARHHKGKGKKNNRRDAQADDLEDDDAHWADLHTRDAEPEPHHKGKGKKNNRREPEVDIEARHHKGKGKKNNRREAEPDVEDDDAHWADLHTRDAEPEPHHKGKGKKNNRREPEVDIEARHHKGKGKKNNRREAEPEVEDAELEARDPEPHHKGKGKKNNRREPEVDLEVRHHKGKGKAKNNAAAANKREAQADDLEDDDAHWADLHTREAEPEPHHKGKGKKNNRREASPHHRGKGKAKGN